MKHIKIFMNKKKIEQHYGWEQYRNLPENEKQGFVENRENYDEIRESFMQFFFFLNKLVYFK